MYQTPGKWIVGLLPLPPALLQEFQQLGQIMTGAQLGLDDFDRLHLHRRSGLKNRQAGFQGIPVPFGRQPQFVKRRTRPLVPPAVLEPPPHLPPKFRQILAGIRQDPLIIERARLKHEFADVGLELARGEGLEQFLQFGHGLLPVRQQFPSQFTLDRCRSGGQILAGLPQQLEVDVHRPDFTQ